MKESPFEPKGVGGRNKEPPCGDTEPLSHPSGENHSPQDLSSMVGRGVGFLKSLGAGKFDNGV